MSVVIPTFNRDQLLKETIASVVAAGPRIGQIIVVDDARDDVSDVRADLIALDPAGRIEVAAGRRLYGAGRGAPAARNAGLALATMPYVQFIDDDDLLSAEGLEPRARILDSDDKVDFVVGPTLPFLDEVGDSLPYRMDFGPDDLAAFLSGAIPWMTSGPLWRRTALQRIGGWNEKVRMSQDLDLHIRALAHGVPYRKVGSVAYYYRTAGEEKMSARAKSQQAVRGGERTSGFAETASVIGPLGAFDGLRRRASVVYAIELALNCRLAAGSFADAIRSVRAMREQRAIGVLRMAELWLALRLWFVVGRRYPSRSYLIRRYPSLRVHGQERIDRLKR